MKRVMLRVAYDGTEYCGWQAQPNGITIESVLNGEISALTGEEVAVIGASRTDSGVHALGNVCVFDTDARIPAEKFSYALNARLPGDIVVWESKEVPPDFHPRHCNCTKTYEYRIYNSLFPNPLLRRYSHFVYRRLDLDAMRQAADFLVGEHDFKSFCSIHANVQSTVRRVNSIVILESGKTGQGVFFEGVGQRVFSERKGMPGCASCGLLAIRINGNGFLYNMVRIIVGTLLEVGYGKSPEWVREVLEKKDRSAAGSTAPACGLTLLGISYLENDFFGHSIKYF